MSGLNLKQLYKRIEKDITESFAEVQTAIDIETDRVIESSDEFSDLGFTDQDIVDTGRLLNSKVVESKEREIKFSWNPVDPESGAAYAGYVWTGFSAGNKYIPGRKWDLRAVSNVKPAKILSEELEKKGYNVTKVEDNNYL